MEQRENKSNESLRDLSARSGVVLACGGFHSDCGEDSTVSVSTQTDRVIPLCEECAEEYRNYLLAIGWTIHQVGQKIKSD